MRFDRLRTGLRGWFRSLDRAVLTVVFLVAAFWLSYYGVQSLRTNAAVRAAVRAMERYDFPTARKRLAAAADIRPNRPNIWLLAAQAARRDGDLDQAKKHLAEYTTRTGLETTPEGQLEASLQFAQQGQVERDIYKLMTLADARHPATEQILESLAIGSTQIYHFDKAGFWLHHLLEQFPRNPIGRYIRATMDNVLGKRERAMAGCRELLADFPDDVKARQLLANMLSRNQQFAEASDEYERLNQQLPNDFSILLGLVRSCNHLAQVDKVRDLMPVLLEKFPENSEVLLEGGRFALTDNLLSDAERVLRHAIELAPSDHEVHYHLGLCLERLGKTDEAQFHLKRFQEISADLTKLDGLLQAIVKSPRDANLRREAGLICLRNGQTSEGMRWLNGALEIAPNDPATLNAIQRAR